MTGAGVNGVDLDPQTRCIHWRGPLDVVAIRMACCGAYYACRQCHDALADHAAAVWPKARWREDAVMCGVCGERFSVWAYLACDNRCPSCAVPFNPGCRAHHHLYFEALG